MILILFALAFLAGLIIGGFATLGFVVWLEQESDRVRGILQYHLADDTHKIVRMQDARNTHQYNLWLH